MQCQKLNDTFFSGSEKELEYEFYTEDSEGNKTFYDPISFTIKLIDKFDNTLQTLNLSDTVRMSLGTYRFVVNIPRYFTNEIMYLEVVDLYNSKETTNRLKFDIIFANNV